MAANLRYRQHPLVTAVEDTLPKRPTPGLVIDDDGKVVASSDTPSLANRPDIPDLSLFAGFLGDEFDHADKTWWLLFLDSRLDRWLLVPKDDIVVFEELTDDKAPDRKRDVLWVNAGARLLQGSGSRTIEGRFVVGEFTRAGDFAATTTGGTFAAATGLLCEALTPGCYCFTSKTR